MAKYKVSAGWNFARVRDTDEHGDKNKLEAIVVHQFTTTWYSEGMRVSIYLSIYLSINQ